MRKRLVVLSIVVIFAVYMYLLHTAHALHTSKTTYSPICQPVATESSRAIQILKELQVVSQFFPTNEAKLLLIQFVGTNAANIRV
jgi:hypothetical protein